jgi:pimeloyl-ACP methyl ester carboxylesterase
VGTYVLIHGAWHGGWCWDTVAEDLESAGHAVLTPTLTGLGSRSAELTPEVGLATHVQDVVTAVERPDLDPVVLVGHSYAGMVVVGAAAALAGRVARLVVVDGFLPERGETALELLPERAAAHYRDSAAERGDGWRVPPRPLANLGVTDERLIAELTPRLTDHPLRTYSDTAAHGASELTVPSAYLLCAGWNSPFRPHAERARALGWPVTEIDADHEVPVTAPALLAAQLLTLATAPAGEAAEEASA